MWKLSGSDEIHSKSIIVVIFSESLAFNLQTRGDNDSLSPWGVKTLPLALLSRN